MNHSQQDVETFWRPALDAMALEVQQKEAMRTAQMTARLLQRPPSPSQEAHLPLASAKLEGPGSAF